jgi:DNA polymerase III epsilon subunit-like protein
VCDVETTGLDPVHDQITEIALIITDFTDVYAALESLVRPSGGFTLPEDSQISHEMLVDVPSFSDLGVGVCSLIAWCDEFLAYNVGFEVRFLTKELSRIGLTMPERRLVDPMVVLQGADHRRYKLVDACERMKVELGADYPWHRAFADAAATLKLAQALKMMESTPTVSSGRPFGVKVRF